MGPAFLRELQKIYDQSGIRDDLAGMAQHYARHLLGGNFLPGDPAKPVAPEPPYNPYIILGVDPEDSPEMIRSVYRAKIKHLHPDQSQQDGERFRKIHEAYQVITGITE